jgi:hypothetical protein
MRKHFVVGAWTMLMVPAVALVATAQDDAARQQWLQWRQTQHKAIQAIQADGVKLRALFDEAGRAVPEPDKWKSMSEQERAKFREANKGRWDEHLKVLGDIEEQVAILKGPWQLQAELDEAVKDLTAARDQALQEKAKKTAEQIQALIDKRKAKHAELMKKLGFQQ